MTTHDETERKKREELQAEIEDGKKKIRQLENREKVLRQKLSQEERRTRSHRLTPGGSQKIKQLGKRLTAFFFVKYCGFTGSSRKRGAFVKMVSAEC